MTKPKVNDYRQLPGFETKRIPNFVKEIDEVQGIVKKFVAIIGNMDDGGDVIEVGAFRKTLSERGRKVRHLDMHKTDSILSVIGKPLELQEVGREELIQEVLDYAPDAAGALMAVLQYAISTDNGRNAFELVKGGFVDESSIGYDATQVAYKDIVTANGTKRKVRSLKEIRLWECSDVIWGMNPATAVVDVKAEGGGAEGQGSGGEDAKAVTGFQDFPLADRNRAWNASAAEKRVREWAGGEEEMDWARYAQCFLWYDADNKEQFTSYKLPYADIISGEPHVVPHGIFAGAAALQGARGGVDIPDADQEKIKKHVSKYYAKMREAFEDETLVDPWEKAAKAVNLTQQIEEIESAFRAQYNPPNDPWEYWVREVYDEYLIIHHDSGSGSEYFQVAYTRNDEEIIFAPRGEWIGGAYVFVSGKAKKEYSPDRGPVRRIGDCLQGCIHKIFTTLCDDWYIAGMMNRDERILCSRLIGDALDLLDQGMPVDLAGREISNHSYYYWDALLPDLEAKALRQAQDAALGAAQSKAGRVLSRANTERLQRALAEIHEILMAAGMMDEGGDNDDDQQGKVGGPNGSPAPIPGAGPSTASPALDILNLLTLEQEHLDLLRQTA